jgi:hypothetical protein
MLWYKNPIQRYDIHLCTCFTNITWKNNEPWSTK